MTGRRLSEEAVRSCITIADIAHLPTVDVPTAGRVLGIGRDAAYAAAAAGQLPTLRLGRALRVPTAKLLTMLGASVRGNDPGNGEAGPASPATTSTPAPLKRLVYGHDDPPAA
jgi:hypothetical protein